MMTEMAEVDVVHIVQLLTSSKIPVHVDGGWAVDALLGEQTRPHNDLDIAVKHADVPLLRDLLEQKGYREVPRDDSWECNFVLGDSFGHAVDVHSYTFDAQGNCVHGVPYPAASLTGSGKIGGMSVDCTSAEWLVKFHTGYELDEDDYQDVSALCARFGLQLPSEYDRFVRS